MIHSQLNSKQLFSFLSSFNFASKRDICDLHSSEYKWNVHTELFWKNVTYASQQVVTCFLLSFCGYVFFSYIFYTLFSFVFYLINLHQNFFHYFRYLCTTFLICKITLDFFSLLLSVLLPIIRFNLTRHVNKRRVFTCWVYVYYCPLNN